MCGRLLCGRVMRGRVMCGRKDRHFPRGYLCDRISAVKIGTFLVSTTRFGLRPIVHGFLSLIMNLRKYKPRHWYRSRSLDLLNLSLIVLLNPHILSWEQPFHCQSNFFLSYIFVFFVVVVIVFSVLFLLSKIWFI